MTQLRFALAQIDTCVGALDANAAKVLDYSRKAAAGNAQVVVFPEMTLTGYPIEDLALRRTFRQAAWDKANELATQLNDDGLGDLFVVVGLSLIHISSTGAWSSRWQEPGMSRRPRTGCSSSG